MVLQWAHKANLTFSRFFLMSLLPVWLWFGLAYLKLSAVPIPHKPCLPGTSYVICGTQCRMIILASY